MRGSILMRPFLGYFKMKGEEGIKTIFFTMAYNAERTLGRTIESILNQTVGDFEYYILNNAATDRTKEIIEKYAQMDSRIVPLVLNKNDPCNGGTIFTTLVFASSADYIVWCDADDAYSLDFLEKMIPFAHENKLDIAACGYDSIDGLTGRVLKRRTVEQNLILCDQIFADKFIQYRGFTSTFWGKLLSIPFLKTAIGRSADNKPYKPYIDAFLMLEFFKRSRRAGVFCESMYRWYQYPSSITHTKLDGCFRQYPDYWCSAREYLLSYAPISKINEDFLYAVYLSQVEGSFNDIFQAGLTISEKLLLLRELFQQPLWAETLARDADPQFRNLAARGEFVRQMKERVMALPTTQKERCLAEAVVLEIDKLPKKSR